MIALDVNVLVSAFQPGAADHAHMRSWLAAAVDGDESVGVSDVVLAGTLRILTHPRIFDPPTALPVATAAIGVLLAHPQVQVIRPLPGHWERTRDLALTARCRGNDIADAAHAALAIQHGATLVTKDRRFARFPGLRWRDPLDDPAAQS